MKNPSTGTRVIARGRRDMAEVIVAFRNFTNATKIGT